MDKDDHLIYQSGNKLDNYWVDLHFLELTQLSPLFRNIVQSLRATVYKNIKFATSCRPF